MDCRQVQDLLSDFLDGSLPEQLRDDVGSHLRECLPCRGAMKGLEETVALLRRLTPGDAPPQLLDGIRQRIEREDAKATPLWKRLFLPAHIKIPLEAAAAILLFLLVYGARKEELPAMFSPPPAVRTEAAPAAGNRKAAAERDAEEAKSAPKPAQTKPRAAPADEEPSGHVSGEAVDSGRVRNALPAPSAPQSAPPAQPPLPVVPAQRVSTSGERIEPSDLAGEKAGEEAAGRLTAAPPPWMGLQAPESREMTIEVSASSRAGLEDRIAAAALRLGGRVVGEAAPGAVPEGAAGFVRVHLPAESAQPFLDELSKLGSFPREEEPGAAAAPGGISSKAVSYTVRIRIR